MFETVNLSFQYEGREAKALDDISFHIEKGSFTVLLGHNGSGKSTLAKHLDAFLLPAGGKVYVKGLDTSDEKNLSVIRRTTGMVFQNPDNQIVAAVVEDDVAFGPENLGIPTGEMRKRVDDALKKVGMYEYKDHAPNLLSGGQKQRVAIAGIIAMRPEAIVLDEPTAMLDPKGRREVIDTILALNKEYGITVVLITHHMDETIYADRMIVMNRGKIYLDGKPKELFQKAEKLKSIGLDLPMTVTLCQCLNQTGWNLPMDAITVEECGNAILKAIKEKRGK